MKRVRHFIEMNISILKDKKTAFFICGIGNSSEMIDFFKKQVDTNVISHSLMIKHFGGELRPDKAHFLMKVIMQKMALDPNFKSHIYENEITAFIKKIKEIKQ
jgi:menaquinone-dependent protoporphyrinogen IX oxidase